MFSVDKQKLLHGLDIIEPGTTERGAHPYVGMVLLHTEGDELRLSATNLLLSVDTMVQADTLKPGSVAVNFKKLRAVVSAMPDADFVKISVDKGQRLHVTCRSKRSYHLALVPGQDFPASVRPTEDAQAKVTFQAPELARALNRVRYALPTTSDRPYIDGVLLEVVGKKLTSIAMQGATWALFEQEVSEPVPEGTIFIPAMAIKSVLGFTTEHKQVSLQKDTNTLFVEAGTTRTCVSLPAGEFPPWRMVLASFQWQTLCDVHCPAAIEALRAVLAARSSEMACKLQLTKSELEFSLSDTDGDARDSVPVDGALEDWEIYMNPGLLLDTMRAADANFHLQRAADSNDQIVVRTDDGFTGIIARVSR